MKCSNCGFEPMDEVCRACGNDQNDEVPEREIYTARFDQVLAEVHELARGEKTTAYGEAWADTGLRGIYIKLMIKEARLREMVWNKSDPTGFTESVRDTLLDMVAYATYGILSLDDANIDGNRDELYKIAKTLEELIGEKYVKE